MVHEIISMGYECHGQCFEDGWHKSAPKVRRRLKMGIQEIDTFVVFEDTLAQTSGARGVTTGYFIRFTRNQTRTDLWSQRGYDPVNTTYNPHLARTDLWSQRGYDHYYA